MSPDSPALFPELFGSAPHLVRGFLQSALQLRDLQQLYVEARTRYPELELSQKLLKVLNVELEITPQDLERFPKTGPVLVVANHPFGILDGMLLDAVLLRARADIKILTNSILCGIEELRHRCLPIEVFGGDAALGNNVKCLRTVLGVLRRGGGIAFFPAGEVSHWRQEHHCVTDPPWSTVAVRCATLANAPIVPLYFKGGNSLAFQLAGLLHPRLRTAKLPGELLNKRNRTIEVRVGSAIRASELRKFESIERATDYLRARTYMLGHRKEARPAACKRLVTLPLFANRQATPKNHGTSIPHREAEVVREVDHLQSQGKAIIQTADYSVFLERGDRISALLREVGRLREITFRAAGEGTGKLHDLDSCDSYYHHLILWHKGLAKVAGSYRLAWTEDVLPLHGISGLYTSSLFRFQPGFFSRLGPALELGRSFIRTEFQREYAPLLLLWQAIARTAATRPEAPVLFGAVSISGEYSQLSRDLIVQFISERGFRQDLASFALPRNPFRAGLNKGFDLKTVSQCLPDLDALSCPIADIGDGPGVPVLLRQYFKMGGRVAGFNVDRAFCNTLDGLLIVDLRETSPRMLDRYMGPQLGSEYRSKVSRPLAL